MQIYAAYIAVLAAYSPGLYFLYKAKYTSRFPLLAFCFIGLFLFNAAG